MFKNLLFIIAFISITKSVSAQKSSSIACDFTFGGNSSGEITIDQLLSDSITWACSPAMPMKVQNFGLATKCDGITRYFTNYRNGSLTNQMKANVKELKPGCEVTFMNILAIPADNHSSYSTKSNQFRYRIVAN